MYTKEQNDESVSTTFGIMFLIMLLLGGFLNAVNAQDIELGVGVEVDIPVYFDYKDIDAVSAARLTVSWDSTHFDYVDVVVAPQWDSLGFFVIENEDKTGSGIYDVAMANSDTLECDTLMLNLKLRSIGDNFASGQIVVQGKFNEVDTVFVHQSYYIIDSSLPVQLTRFHANVGSNHTTIRWNTSSETNNAKFEVYAVEYVWAPDGRWLPRTEHYLGFRDGQGTTIEPHAYSLVANLPAGSYRFKLKQIDFNGEHVIYFSDYYDVLLDEPTLYAYPVPTNQTLTVAYTSPRPVEVEVKIYDILGREVAHVYDGWVNGITRWELDISSIANGIYIVVGKSGTNTISRRIIIVK